MTPVNGTNGWKLTQRGLIDKVLDTTGLTNCNSNLTPTSSTGNPLGKDTDREPCDEDWNYASVVGMLYYIWHPTVAPTLPSLCTKQLVSLTI